MTFKGLSVKSPVNNFMGDTVTVPFISSPTTVVSLVCIQLLRAVGFMGCRLCYPSVVKCILQSSAPGNSILLCTGYAKQRD